MTRRKFGREFKIEAVKLVIEPGVPESGLAEIAALKKEVVKLKAERDILKRPRHSLRGKRHDVRFRREAPVHLAG